MEEDNIIVPCWFLEVVENTLRIQYNINLDKKTGETCQDRNIKESLNGVRKLLKGEELTGGERLERLRPSLPSNLDEAAEQGVNGFVVESFNPASERDKPIHGITLIYEDNGDNYVVAGDHVEVLIRKKEGD